MKNSKHKKVKKNNTKKKNNQKGGRGGHPHISRGEERATVNRSEGLEPTSNESTTKLPTKDPDDLKSKFLRMIKSKDIDTDKKEKDTDKEGSLGISVGVPPTFGYQKGNPLGINFKFKSDSHDKEKKTVNTGLIPRNKGLQKAQRELNYTQQQYKDLGKQQDASLAAQSAIEAISPFPINDQLMLPLEKYDGIMSGISKAIAKSNSKGLESSKLRNNFEDLIDLKVSAWLENAKIATDMRTNSNIISYAGNVIKQLKSFMEELNKFGLPLDQALDMLVSIASSITNQSDEMQDGATGAMQAEADSRNNLDKETEHEVKEKTGDEIKNETSEVKPKSEVQVSNTGQQTREVQKSEADQQPESGQESVNQSESETTGKPNVSPGTVIQQGTNQDSDNETENSNLMINNSQGLDRINKPSSKVLEKKTLGSEPSFKNRPSSSQPPNYKENDVRENPEGGTDAGEGAPSSISKPAQRGGSKRSKNKKKKKNKSKKNKKNKKKFILNKSKNYLKISPFSYSDCKF